MSLVVHCRNEAHVVVYTEGDRGGECDWTGNGMMEGRDGNLLGQVIVLTGSHAGVEVGEEGEHKCRGDLVACVSE